eukprot:jgi/Tetstr1/436959/TSEL_025731.t1
MCCTLAGSAEEALRILAERWSRTGDASAFPQQVIMGLCLPGMSGEDAAGVISERYPDAVLPVTLSQARVAKLHHNNHTLIRTLSSHSMPTTDCATAPVSTAAGGVWQFLRRVGGFLARVVLSAPRQALRLAPGRGERGPRSTADAGREANQGQAREKPDEAMQARQASSPKSSRRLAVGPKLDVSVEGLIGRGAAGKVALKVCYLDRSAAESMVPTIEGLLGESLRHPNVVQVYGSEIVQLNDCRDTMMMAGADGLSSAGYSKHMANEADSLICKVHVVQEYCSRGDLRGVLKRGGLEGQKRGADGEPNPPHIPAALTLALDVASGMTYIHSMN